MKTSVAKLRLSLVLSAMLLMPTIARADGIPPEYVRAIHDSVAKATVYPKMAKLRGQEGKVSCLVKIAPTGALVDATVETPSGTNALDQAALEAVKRAAPFQPPPGAGADGATVHISLVFALTD